MVAKKIAFLASSGNALQAVQPEVRTFVSKDMHAEEASNSRSCTYSPLFVYKLNVPVPYI